MKKSFFVAGAAVSAAVATLGGAVFAVAQPTEATISGGAWNICVSADFEGSAFVAELSGEEFATQLSFDEVGCQEVVLPEGEYRVALRTPMGIEEVSQEIEGSSLLKFTASGRVAKYLRSNGELHYSF